MDKKTEATIMENQIKKKQEKEMETESIWRSLGVYISQIVNGDDCKGMVLAVLQASTVNLIAV